MDESKNRYATLIFDLRAPGILKESDKISSLYSKKAGKENRIKFYAVNKSDETLDFTVYKASVNGIKFYEYENAESDEKVYLSGDGGKYSHLILKCAPGCKAIGSFWMDERFLEDNRIEVSDVTEFVFGLDCDKLPSYYEFFKHSFHDELTWTSQSSSKSGT